MKSAATRPVPSAAVSGTIPDPMRTLRTAPPVEPVVDALASLLLWYAKRPSPPPPAR